MTDTSSMRLVVVSNRLPIAMRKDGDRVTVAPGSGGLVTALAPVLKDRGGVWIGWPGHVNGDVNVADLLKAYSKEAGYRLHPVILSDDEVKGFYHGFSNEIAWPLFHDFHLRSNFEPAYWQTYLQVNKKFADIVSRFSRRTDYVWVHDYHLMHLSQMLKEMNHDRKTGFFLHIPFPAADIFLKMPWRTQIMRALLQYDTVGFQTTHDRHNFLDCLDYLVPQAKKSGRGPIASVAYEGRTIRVGAFPISIDFQAFAQLAASETVERNTRNLVEAFGNRKIILGVDRLDYTKGIPQRLEAIREALKRYPHLAGNICFVQILVPSREEVLEYQNMKTEIERLVGEINGQFTIPGWIPIHYIYRSLPREELVAYYRAANMALVTPLKDGMNLVAKEYVACCVDENGILFLSEFAGAASHFQRMALLVNPYDVEGVAWNINRGFDMDAQERRRRMRKMRAQVRKYNIFWWVDTFLQAAFGRQLVDFPPMAEVDYFSMDDKPESA